MRLIIHGFARRYGDETSNMGSTGWLDAMCFNLPQQHFLGCASKWHAVQWRNSPIPHPQVDQPDSVAQHRHTPASGNYWESPVATE